MIEQLSHIGIHSSDVKFNLSAEALCQKTLDANEGILTDSGALCINTGRFTGRSPKDRFIVQDAITAHSVDWNQINMPISTEAYKGLKAKIQKHLSSGTVYVKDGQAGADKNYRINVRLVAEKPWSAQFVNNMFLRLSEEELQNFNADWHILCAPTFKADPLVDETRQENFSIINFTEKTILIGGTGYTGEIKKGIFSVLNFELPTQEGVLSMHCSANVGKEDDTAIFFGLSGTGKTTLSTDPNRALIGDDEHGWSDRGVFNFEGGCYAKCIDLSPEKEPEIYKAIRPGAILENITFHAGTNIPDYSDGTITQNTRVSYPIYHIDNAQADSMGTHPNHIFFLTCDAYGVLPPISKLTTEQAMYHFISGYTAKVAGTEDGVSEPEATFSACFGAPFLPLHPTKYADMLGEKMEKHNATVWLVNTGWTGGAFPQGERISLKYTRRIISAALNGELDTASFENIDIFDLAVPTSIDGVPTQVLNPRNTWIDKNKYDDKAIQLAELFLENFKKFESEASDSLLSASPKILVIYTS